LADERALTQQEYEALPFFRKYLSTMTGEDAQQIQQKEYNHMK